MLASADPVVGLIEIEVPADADALVQVSDSWDDASLGELFELLAGRLATTPARPEPETVAAPRQTNRLLTMAAPPAIRLDANLTQLAAELDDQTAAVRLRIRAAGANVTVG